MVTLPDVPVCCRHTAVLRWKRPAATVLGAALACLGTVAPGISQVWGGFG